MIKLIIRRNNKIKKFIDNDSIKYMCRLDSKEYKNTFIRR